MSSTKSQVAVATNIPNLPSGQQQKDYNTEESLGRQNSFGLNRRGNMKGKHLTRSHAMREATSPPRTPTPRASESSSQMSPNGYQQQQQHHQQQHMDVNESNNNNNSNNKLHTQSSATRGNSPIIDTPTVIVTSQHKQQQQQPQQQQLQQSNVALCNETEFPKLSPPKSKSGSNSSTGGSGGGGVAAGSGNSSSSSSSGGGGVSSNNNCNTNNNNPQRINNASEGHNNNNNNTNTNTNTNNSNNSSNKKTNGDTAGVNNETHNKATNNVNMNAGNANKNYNQSQQQQFNAGTALQKALNVTDNSQSTQQSIYNSPMNYQLHPNDVNREQQQQQSYVVYDKENRCPRNDSQNSMNSNDEIHYETQQQQPQQHQQQQQHQQHQSQQHHQRTGGGKKHRTNSNSKGSKPRLKNMGSTNSGGGGGGSVSNMGAGGGSVVAGGITSGSIEGSLNSSNNTSGFISRENSNEQYTDHGGTDLLSFFKETLNKNVKDRQFLLKVEKDLIEFVQEGNRGEIRFPQASSYNRMLIHRTAAFFGMEHNVDTETQQCVIVAPTKNTRIPEIRFKTLVINNRDDSRKSILKRDTHSFDEARQSSYLCPDRGGMLDRKVKSFEEREEDYDRARSRIFNRSQNEACPGGGGSTDDDNNYISWTSSVDQQQFSRGRSSGKVLKIQNSPDGRGASVVQKSNNNFGNYSQGGAPLIRGDSANSNKSMGAGSGNGTRIFSKQDSAGSSNTSWRLSPSSSGYKTQTQSIRSDSVTPSPTGGYGSDEPHLPDHPSVIANREINDDTTTLPSGLVWAVTDISNVPKGSILINPQTLQPILNADGTVYHYDPSNMPPAQAMASGGNVVNSGGGNIYHTNQNNSPSQQHPMHNPLKKQHKGHQMQQQPQQQFNKLESATTAATNSGGESVSESSTQTINVGEEVIPSNNMLDVSYQEDDLCNADENDECDNSANGCLSITTTTSTKNYDRIEVQKFKNQATSPNIPISDKDDIVKREHSSQTPLNVTPTQQSQLQQSQTPQQSQTQNRETPHSSRSTPFSNSDTLTKRSSEEPRATSWTQSYQAPDGSTVFHTTTTPNSSTTNPYCTTTYQQGPDGSIYAVPQGMIYAYPPPVEGEFQGYFMPVFDPSQQRNDTTGLLQPGTQAIYPAGGATTMVPVAAYPTAQFATTNGAPIYPSQVIYSGEQFQTAGAPLTATAPASATAQLQQIPMTTYPIGYPYPYNGYWGQTMTYYVPQQAVPATSLLAAPPPPPSAPGNVSHVAGVVNTTGPNGVNSTAGPSTNSSNTTNTSGHIGNGNTPNTSHQNGSVTTGYQSHVHTVSGGLGSSHTGGTTYYGTGRIKRPTPPHFSSAGTNGGHQVLAAASIPNGVTTATYQLGHAVPTLTLAAAAPPQGATGAPTTTDLSGAAGAPTTATMYALPQHATIFPANMFPYATNAAAPAIGPQSGANMAPQTAIIQPPVNPQGHVVGGVSGQANATAGAIHNPHHSNTVITPFYTTTHHHAPHPVIQSGGHTIHAPGPSAIPIVDPATITNVTQLGPANNSVYSARSGGASNTAGTSQSAPSTPHSMPSSSTLHHSQRNPSVFSTPPILNNNGSNYNSSNSTPHYYGNTEMSHQASVNTGGANNSNSPHNSYLSSSYEKRNNTNSGGGKKPLSYQSASLSRQNSTSGGGGGYNGSGKQSALLNNANNNNDTRASPSSSTNSRPHSIKRGGGGGGGGGAVSNDKPQTPLLSGPPSFVGSANIQNNNNSYHAIPNAEMATGNIPVVNVSKPPIRLNAAAAAFRQKGTTNTGGGGGSAVEYRRNPTSQRNSPGTNASSSNDNSNNNSPNSIHNSSNTATPIAAGCYAPSYMINAQNNSGEPAPTHPPSLYITTAPARGPAHIPPHLQSAAANGAAVPAAAAAATASVPQQAATAVLGGAAAAAAAADVANAAAVAAAAATVAHHHHHQPLLGTYNPGASGLYFKYGHTYFAHPSVALPNSRRSPSTDLRPPIAQMAGMYPTVNMMIPAQPRHPGRHPNPNYKGTRPR